MTRSALYEGTVVHERTASSRTSFTNRVIMPMLDLDELDSLGGLAPLWRAERRAPMAFRRRDFMGDPTRSLATEVRATVLERAGFEPEGPIRLLAQHRTWGWCFNPIALYYCYSRDGETLQAVVADVTNTPWGESHAYVIDTRAGLGGLEEQPKELHVSPFLPMDLSYRFRLNVPGPRCAFSVTVMRADDVVFRAVLSLRRRSLTRREVARALLRHPFATHRVSLGIYLRAARLWSSRIPFVAHPASMAERASHTS
jgi:DUF1365 family protein